MAIHVIQSQRIDVLLQGLLTSVTQRTHQPFSVLKTQHFIVPSAAQEQWLKERLSEQQGIAANYLFHQRIRGFQWYAYQHVLDNKDRVRQANIPRLILKWRIYQALYAYIQPMHLALDETHPLYPIVQRIYDSANQLQSVLDQQQKKQSMLYWVAEHVSRLFSNYMIYRGYCSKGCQGDCRCPTNWLEKWGRGQAIDIEHSIATSDQNIAAYQLQQAQQLEAWQRWLWQHFFHADFMEMQRIDEDFWYLLDQEGTRYEALQKLPQQVVVFTLLDLPPQQLQFLRRLGQYLDVLILHYNPSQEYWADSVDPLWKQRYDLGVKERFLEKNPQATDTELAVFFEQFYLNFNAQSRESRHPLLTRLGKQARDHFSLLSSLSAGEEGQWVDAFVDEFPNTLLGKIQSEILYLVEPQPHQYVLPPDDHSIQIHVCHSTLRQLEVLKEQLIFWLSEHQERAKPYDILILVPDLKSIESLIRSVFPATTQGQEVFLPIKIAGVPQLDVLRAWDAVLGRICLTQGRFHFDEFADWLFLSATQQKYGIDYPQASRMLELLADAGFKRGFDVEHLKQSLSVEDQDYRYSFKFALDRLVLGIAIPEHAVFHGTLSFDGVNTEDFELIGILIEIYQEIASRRHWNDSVDHDTLPFVLETLERLMQDVIEFEQTGVDALKTIREVIKKQQRMLTLATHYGVDHPDELQNIKLPMSIVIEEITQMIHQQSAQAEPTGQITFAQIGQIRPLPYRLIVLLNLDTGVFPQRDHRIPFDLIEVLRQQLGDRSRLEDDQGAFLDALLLAQESLWLFYNGFDANDGELREPSSVLREFRDHLALILQKKDDQPDVEMIDGMELPTQLKALYHFHRLQPFDPLGFVPEKQNIRFQDQWFNVAQHLIQPHGQREPWQNTLNQIEQIDIVSLQATQWIDEVTFPAKLYLRTLGIDNIGFSSLTESTEPLLLNGLERYRIRDFLLQHQQDVQPELLLDQLPVSKVQHSAWQQSIFEQERLLARFYQYAEAVTAVTERVWRVNDQLQLSITVPQYDEKVWVSLEPSSARAQRRAKVWLEYLLWLAYLGDQQPQAPYCRIVVFSDQTVICEGLNTLQARQYLAPWFELWRHAQQQPVVLPAALLLKPLEQGKAYEWRDDTRGQMHLDEKSRADLLKHWNDNGVFSSIDMTQNQASKLHRDWQFILQEQDAQALLSEACEQYAYVLYAPIYQYQRAE